MLKKDLRKGHVSECYVCSAWVPGSQVFITSLSAPQPAENSPNYSRSGLTIPRSSAGPALLQPLPCLCPEQGLFPSSPCSEERASHLEATAPPPPQTWTTYTRPGFKSHLVPGLCRDPPDPEVAEQQPQVPRGVWRVGPGASSPRSEAMRDAQVRRVLIQSRSNERWSQVGDPGGQMSAWALEPLPLGVSAQGRRRQLGGAAPTRPALEALQFAKGGGL